jgi:hypothetical protein
MMAVILLAMSLIMLCFTSHSSGSSAAAFVEGNVRMFPMEVLKPVELALLTYFFIPAPDCSDRHGAELCDKTRSMHLYS